MIICSRCKTENEDGVKFCRECGNDLITNVDAPANEDLKSLADSLNEQAVHTEKQPFNLNKAISDFPKKIGNGIKKIGNFVAGLFRRIGKKKLIVISSSVVVIIACTILTVNYIIPFAPHYFNGNSALKSADYATAITEYELAKSFLNAKSKLNETHYLYAEKLYGEEKFYDASTHYNIVVNYDDTHDKLIQCGTKLLENKEYKKSLDIFEMIETDEVSQFKNYASGMNSLNNGSYEDAKKSFTAAGDYNDSKSMINACDLMIAEDYCEEGKFDQAKTIYSRLPEGFTYNGISSSNRIALLNNSQGLINAMGTWTASDYYIESRNIYKRTGSWDSWYWSPSVSDLTGQDLELSCTMNSNGTFDITGEASFYKCDDYSSLSEYCKANKTSESFTISNVTSIPASYQIDSYTTLNYSGGVFSIKYSQRDNYSSYFYNVYSSSVTYGNKS